MTQKTKNKSLSETLDETEKIISGLMTENNSEELKDLEKAVAQFKISIKGLQQLTLIIFAALCICLGYIFFGSLYNKQVEEFNTEIKDLRTDSIVRKILEMKDIKAGDTTGTSYSYIVRNEKIVSYNQLLKERDSIKSLLISTGKKYDNLEIAKAELQSKLNLGETKLRLAIKYYNIEYFVEGNNVAMRSKKIDSAFVLLDVYRNKMRYDPKNDSWTISP